MMALEDYEELRDLCPKKTAVGDEITGEIIYYSARKVDQVMQKRDANGPLYRMKISKKAFAVAVDSVSIDAGHCDLQGVPAPEALSAEAIICQCRKKPKTSELFRRSETHKGQNGKIENGAKCIIMQAGWFNPPSVR